MIRLVCTIAVVLVISSCGQNQPAAEVKSDAAPAAKADSTTYPYKANYSSSFDFGKSEDAKTVLSIWKAYEDNNFASTKDLWADSATLQFEDFTFHGSRDSVMKGGADDRAHYTSVIDSVDAWIPLHSKDKNEDWVAVWGREYTVDKKGKKDTADLHEIWLLKSGKVAYVSQYRAHRKR